MYYSEAAKQVATNINRNILECKDNLIWNEWFRDEILIETYWNVKVTTSRLRVITGRILIETYWNVKQFVECKRIPIFNINRNILECKGCSLPAV